MVRDRVRHRTTRVSRTTGSDATAPAQCHDLLPAGHELASEVGLQCRDTFAVMSVN